MASEDISILEGVLTTTEPLGPVDQTLITEDDVAESLLSEEVRPYNFERVSSNPYVLLLGRRGSGKSAILHEIRLNLQPSLGGMQNDVRLPKKGEPYIIPVLSWIDFDKIRQNVIEVMMKYQVDNPLSDLVPSERYTSLWYKVLWVEIIKHFFGYCHLIPTLSNSGAHHEFPAHVGSDSSASLSHSQQHKLLTRSGSVLSSSR